MKRSLILFTALILLLSLSLAACGQTPAQTGQPGPAVPAEPLKLTVGASPAPHAEILEFVKPALLDAGYELEIVIFTDYVLPNTALVAGELDANYFQHTPFLQKFNTENGADLAVAAEIHFEPLGLYAGRTDVLMPDGAEIGIPADATNEARALQLLDAQGIITLKAGVGLEATPLDIVDNPKVLRFFEAEAALLPHVLADVDFAIINGNYAIDAGITDKLLVSESSDSEGAQRFANVIAVQGGHENDPAIQALVKALTTEEVKQFILEKYSGYVVPVF